MLSFHHFWCKIRPHFYRFPAAFPASPILRSRNVLFVTAEQPQPANPQSDSPTPSQSHLRNSVPDLKAVNTLGDDHKVRPVTKAVTLQLAHNAFAYAFPKHSLTILKLKAE